MRQFYRPKKNMSALAAKRNGASAEEEVEALAARLLLENKAEINKRFEPYKRVGGGTAGGFRAVNIGKSGCDYEILLPDGRAGHLEVKSREADRITKDALDPVQQAQLARRVAWGQLAIVLVRLKGVWFVVNYANWHLGDRKSHNATQLEEIGVRLGAAPDFLQHI